MKNLTLLLLALTLPISAHPDHNNQPPTADPHGQPPVKAPDFQKGEDQLAINDWWNAPAPQKHERERYNIINLQVPRDQVIAFGSYTTSNQILKLTAQLYPLYPKETRSAAIRSISSELGSASRRATPAGLPPEAPSQKEAMRSTFMMISTAAITVADDWAAVERFVVT
ncbi:MAG: hypothetical protein AAGC74_14070 [Verrucomicrobiota bacterium]